MKSKRRRGLPKKRQRESKTDYRKRLKLLSSRTPRLVIRRSLNNIYAQIIEYQPAGDQVLVSASTDELRKKYHTKLGRNIVSSYLTGYLLGHKALHKKISHAIADLGLQTITKGSVLFSCLKGAVDAGLDVPHSEDAFPVHERIQGKHLKNTIPLEQIKTKIQAEKK